MCEIHTVQTTGHQKERKDDIRELPVTNFFNQNTSEMNNSKNKTKIRPTSRSLYKNIFDTKQNITQGMRDLIVMLKRNL